MLKTSPLIAATALLLCACSSASDSASSQASETSDPAAAALTVAASHYPVEFLVQRVGGEGVTVRTLTTPGTEPHDLELTPQQVAEVQDAAAVFYIGGFQPTVDDAVGEANGTVVDLTQGLQLRAADDHAHEGEADHAEEEQGGTDPHVWLSPVLMEQMADEVLQTLSAASPENAATFTDNAAQLKAELASLNDDWTKGTESCEIATMVVSHEAFGYLADQYGFEQRGISGLSPENEPSAAAIAELTEFVKANGVTTVYTEELVDPSVAQTVAAEAGVQTALLSTLESKPENGDYLTAMQDNLATVSAGQSCS